VYGGTAEPTAIELDHNALWHAIKKEAFHASILDMELNGSESKVLLRNVQMHPFKQLILHVDFQRVEANTKLQMKVPLHFSGEESSPAVKLDACLINHIVNELEVACLPADLPEFINEDLSNLKKCTSLHVNDMVLPKGVTAVTRGKENPVIVSVVTPVAEVIEAPAADAAPAKGKAAAKTKK
jgi:large subunit ribosomal protein L25